MVVNFLNVTISIEAETPPAAYGRLCEVLGVGANDGDLEYTTDTYTLDPEQWDGSHSTNELWPQPKA